MRTFKREFYRPKQYTDHFIDKAAGTEVYFYEYTKPATGKIVPCMIAFGGKRNKPDRHFSYPDKLARTKAYDDYIAGQKSWLERKAKVQEDRKAFKHSLQIGAVLSMSWGYDQTNVNFFEVVELVGPKMVRIREIGLECVEGRGGPSERVVARRGNFLSRSQFLDRNGRFGNMPTLKKVGAGNCIGMTSYASLSPWGGQPKHQTGFGWGH